MPLVAKRNATRVAKVLFLDFRKDKLRTVKAVKTLTESSLADALEAVNKAIAILDREHKRTLIEAQSVPACISDDIPF